MKAFAIYQVASTFMVFMLNILKLPMALFMNQSFDSNFK